MYRFGDLLVDSEHIREFAIVAVGPDVASVGDVDQLSCDTDSRARLPDAAFENLADIKLTANFADVACLLPELKARGSRHDLKLGVARQDVNQFLREALAKVFAVW